MSRLSFSRIPHLRSPVLTRRIQTTPRAYQSHTPPEALTFFASTMSDTPRPPPLGPSQAGAVPNQGPPKLHLYTAGTPNGYKVSVLLEELRAAYPDLAQRELSYDVSAIEIWKNQQKHPEFLAINPNGRIPALVDDNFGGHKIFESASIELWLAENYDPDGKFWFTDPKLRSEALSWIFFAHGGIGPMQGQAHHFFRYAPVKSAYGIRRYVEETERLYSVLEDGLAKSDWLVGDKFSVADINVFPWVRSHVWAAVDINKFPRLAAWLKRIDARPATQKGLLVPTAPADRDDIAEESYKEGQEWIKKGIEEVQAAQKD